MAEYFYFKNLFIENKHLLFKDSEGCIGNVESCFADIHMSYKKVVFKSDVKKNSNLINNFKQKIADAINNVKDEDYYSIEEKINNSNFKIDRLLKLNFFSTAEKIIIDKDLLKSLYGEPIICESKVFSLKPKLPLQQQEKNNFSFSGNKRKFFAKKLDKENQENYLVSNSDALFSKSGDIFYYEEPFEPPQKICKPAPWTYRRRKADKENLVNHSLPISPKKKPNAALFWEKNNAPDSATTFDINPQGEISWEDCQYWINSLGKTSPL